MKIKEKAISEAINQIKDLLAEIEKTEATNRQLIGQVATPYNKSARNLIHYSSLRQHDIRGLQKKLRNLGLSRFANANGHVKASLLNSKYILECLIGKPPVEGSRSGLSIKNGYKLQSKFARELLGFRSRRRRVRIMVTQPTETAENYQLVYDMVKNGMNCARINCAHDHPEVWLKIIQNVKKASAELGRKVKIAMDLAGPKIRTGKITPGSKIRKFTPERDHSGKVIKPAYMMFVLAPEHEADEEIEKLPVSSQWLQSLVPGDRLNLTDTRGKERALRVLAREADGVLASCNDTVYIGTGTHIDAGDKGTEVVGELPPIEQYILLRQGDTLMINKTGFGEPADYDTDGNLLKPAHLSCQVPEIFSRVKTGEPILFDDGKIEGLIMNSSGDALEVKITQAKEPGAKLKAEKGINFPTSDLQISGLTSKDKEDLKFVAEHADIVNFSFVNSKADVEELLNELTELKAAQIHVIYKIETQKAFDNLTEIILTAMKKQFIGIMIARGDLAVETGWDKIGRVQKEILGICSAAHVPVIWATQVFENLAKKGIPSRAEVTDATTSLKADCVMLNKGAYINQAISLLDRILRDMEKYDEKNESMLPSMEKLLKSR